MAAGKDKIARDLAERKGLTIKEAKENYEDLIDIIKGYVTTGEGVQLQGLGSIKLVARDARKGRNPQTGKEIDIPAKMAPKMTFSEAFKDSVK